MPNVGPYIYDVSISGFTRSSIYIYDISSLRVNRVQSILLLFGRQIFGGINGVYFIKTALSSFPVVKHRLLSANKIACVFSVIFIL